MKKVKLLALMLLILVAFTSLAGCNTQKAAETPSETPEGQKYVKIGLTQSQTGPAAALGIDITEGVLYAVDLINDGGGLNIDGEKYLIDLVRYDDESKPATATSVTHRLIEQDKVVAIIGSTTSTAVLAARDVNEAARIPVMVPCAASPAVTEGGYEYIFRTIITGVHQSEAIANYMTQDLGLKTAVYLGRNDDWGRSALEAFKERLEGYGGELLLAELFEPGTTDHTTTLNKVKQLNPDFVFAIALHEDGVPLLQQYRELGITAEYATTDVDVTFFDAVGNEAVGAYTYYGTGPITPELEKFRAEMTAAGYKWSTMGDMGYDPTMVLAQAIERAGKAGLENPTQIRNEILKTNWQGNRGHYTFDESGQANVSLWVTRIVSSDGGREWLKEITVK